MGAYDFATYQDGTDPAQAFRDAVEAAQREHGHGGYTGTIAEKYSYRIATDTPMTEDAAEDYAYQLLAADDCPFSDKYGPAGAIPVLTDRRQITITIPATVHGFASAEEAARDALARTGGLREGESIGYGITGMYRTHPYTGRIVSGDLTVPLQGGPREHTGWLFFGYAAS